MPHQQHQQVPQFLLLPELKLIRWDRDRKGNQHIWCEKTSSMEVCYRCATASSTLYDHRWVNLHDQPIRGVHVYIHVWKRRFYCKTCRKPFTEPVPGVGKGKRKTDRYRRGLLWSCENLQDLSRVRKSYRCSTWMIYSALKQQLELKVKKEINYPWPKTVGIDEHFFSRSKGYREFATVLVDYNHKRVRELVLGRSRGELQRALSDIPGRENVRNVVLDMSDTYKSFAKEFFPNCILIADKFHVLRLLNPALNRRRKEITGDVRKNPVRKLLLRNGKNLEYFERNALHQWLKVHPELSEIYHVKEALYGFYRIKGYNKARRALTKLTDRLALSGLPEIRTFRKTLMRWREEILNYFKTGLTNARTEGFNNVAKLVQKRAYGVKSFEMYRLRYLSACA